MQIHGRTRLPAGRKETDYMRHFDVKWYNVLLTMVNPSGNPTTHIKKLAV